VKFVTSCFDSPVGCGEASHLTVDAVNGSKDVPVGLSGAGSGPSSAPRSRGRVLRPRGDLDPRQDPSAGQDTPVPPALALGLRHQPRDLPAVGGTPGAVGEGGRAHACICPGDGCADELGGSPAVIRKSSQLIIQVTAIVVVVCENWHLVG
jgi:hypothetical protein